MRIAALSLHATNTWPEMGTDALTPGLHVFHGPSASGKSTVADLLTRPIHDLAAYWQTREKIPSSPGEVLRG